MTCASCAARVERGLADLPGVSRGIGQLRVGPGHGRVRSRACRPPRSRRAHHRPRLSRAGRTRGRSRRRRGARRPIPPRARRRAHGAAAGRVDGRRVALLGLGVVGLRVRDARRVVVRVDVPSRGVRERTSRRGDDGHTRVDRHDRGVDVVGRRAPVPERRRDVLRDGRGDRHADPARPVLRSTRARSERARDARVAGARSEDRAPGER